MSSFYVYFVCEATRLQFHGDQEYGWVRGEYEEPIASTTMSISGHWEMMQPQIEFWENHISGKITDVRVKAVLQICHGNKFEFYSTDGIMCLRHLEKNKELFEKICDYLQIEPASVKPEKVVRKVNHDEIPF